MHLIISTSKVTSANNVFFIVGMKSVVKRWAKKHNSTIVESFYEDNELHVKLSDERDYTLFALTWDFSYNFHMVS